MFFQKNKKFDLPNFNSVRIDETNRPKESLIFLIRKRIKFCSVQRFCNIADNLKTG